jgi:alpha 1,2-mannosyltransferase
MAWRNASEGGKPYVLKHLALLSSSCRECLFLDADNWSVRDPTYLFEEPLYSTTGLLLWPDFWQSRAGPASIRRIFSLRPGADTRTVESGQIVLDKARAWETLLLALYMQLHAAHFEPLLRDLHHLGGGGDKQTFIVSALATFTPFSMVPHPVASAGFLAANGAVYCGLTMVQHDPAGRILFVHANLNKEAFRRIAARPTFDNATGTDLREEVIRPVEREGLFSTSFDRVHACGGGMWVMRVAPRHQLNFTEAVGYNLPLRRYNHLHEFYRRVIEPSITTPAQQNSSGNTTLIK